MKLSGILGKHLIERVYNVSKGEKKRPNEMDEASRLAPKILDRYPPLSPSDIADESKHEHHVKILKDELKR